MGMRFWTIFAILVLNILGALFLEMKMTAFTAELVIIVIALILSMIALIGIGTEADWGWSFSTIFFALSLANIVYLLISTRAFGTFTVLLLIYVIGLLVSVLSIKEREEFAAEAVPLEKYEPEPEVIYETKRKKPSKKKRK